MTLWLRKYKQAFSALPQVRRCLRSQNQLNSCTKSSKKQTGSWPVGHVHKLVCERVCMCLPHICGSLALLELDLEVVVSHLTWALGTKLGSLKNIKCSLLLSHVSSAVYLYVFVPCCICSLVSQQWGKCSPLSTWARCRSSAPSLPTWCVKDGLEQFILWGQEQGHLSASPKLW